MTKHLRAFDSEPVASPQATESWSELPRVQRNYITLVTSVGVLVLAFNIVLLANDPNINNSHLGTVAVLFAAILAFRGVYLRRGEDYVEYKAWEYPIVVGLTIAPAYLVTVCFSIAFAAHAVRLAVLAPHKRARALVKFASIPIAASVGCSVASISEPLTYPLGCVIIAVLADMLMFGYDVSRGGFQYARQAWRGNWLKRLSIPLLLATFTSVLVYMIGPQREFLLLTPLALLVLFWMSQSRIEQQDEKASWRQMEKIAAQFIAESNEANTISFALRESLRLFSARNAMLVLYPDGKDPATSYTLRSGPGAKVEVQVLAEDEVPQAPDRHPSRRDTVFHLNVGEKRFGHMILEWDPTAPETPTRRSLTATFSHAVAASIASARNTRMVQAHADTKAKEAEEDPLTKMGNRAKLASLGPIALSEAADVGAKSVLLLFDLDGFKRINDTLGHAAGDEVLVEVARRVKATVRHSDLAIRLGGDEFAILAGDIERPADAEALAAKISRALIPPVEVEGLQLSIEASIGIAICPDDAVDVNTLLKNADIAMYQSKAKGRGGVTRYDNSINYETADSLQLATDLRRAIFGTNELVMHYQPQIDLRTDEVIGVEALVRWQHKTEGLLYPDKFVHIAERSNLIRPFTLAILNMALADRVKMRETIPNGTVSVNLSAQNLLDSGLPADVDRLLTKYGVKADELVLEVTETATANDIVAAQRVLGELADLGCQIAMDDFGTGYATLDSLRSGSPITEIKMDRGFVKDITTNDRDCKVAKAIIEIAHAWDCTMVAEGIEDAETYQALKDLGCDEAQGYFWHRPAPLAEILDWVREHAEDI